MEFENLEMVSGLYPYLSSLAEPSGGVLAEMEEYGQRRRFPLVGPLVGRFLLQLAMLAGARRVLEIGSGFGYSAAWFLQANPELEVICTDNSPLNRERGLEFLARLGVAERVDFRLGDALTIAGEVEGPFDIIFCDMDKSAYPAAFELAVPKLRRGGLFVADNTLWRGYAWTPVPDDAPEFRRKMTPGIREFNRLASSSREVITTIIPLRDGISLSVRL
jgi:predicted O-methyltransferase YrrM